MGAPKETVKLPSVFDCCLLQVLNTGHAMMKKYTYKHVVEDVVPTQALQLARISLVLARLCEAQYENDQL